MEQSYNAIDLAFQKLEEEVRQANSHYILVDCENGLGQRLVKVVDHE